MMEMITWFEMALLNEESDENLGIEMALLNDQSDKNLMALLNEQWDCTDDVEYVNVQVNDVMWKVLIVHSYVNVVSESVLSTQGTSLSRDREVEIGTERFQLSNPMTMILATS